MTTDKPRTAIGAFFRDAHGRFTMDSLVVIDSKGCPSYYDVDWCRTYGYYVFHMSGFGGSRPPEMAAPYFVSGEPVAVQELPSALANDLARERNRTRRLRHLPRMFELKPGWDLLDWLEHRAVNEEVVWCSTCRDCLPGDSLCEHCWWCDKTCAYSTPDDRCKCADREECRD